MSQRTLRPLASVDLSITRGGGLTRAHFSRSIVAVVLASRVALRGQRGDERSRRERRRPVRYVFFPRDHAPEKRQRAPFLDYDVRPPSGRRALASSSTKRG